MPEESPDESFDEEVNRIMAAKQARLVELGLPPLEREAALIHARYVWGKQQSGARLAREMVLLASLFPEGSEHHVLIVEAWRRLKVTRGEKP